MSIILDDLETDTTIRDLLRLQLIELKKIQLHLAVITGETLKEEDVRNED